MNKFTLKMEQPEFNRVVEVSFEEEYLSDVLMQIDMFLKGCGYVNNGELIYSALDFDTSKISVTINDVGECRV